MAKYAFVKFKINNEFSDWEKGFYAAQPIARKAGIVEIFHGQASDDSSTCACLLHVESQEKMKKFFKEMETEVTASGHILESTEITWYEN